MPLTRTIRGEPGEPDRVCVVGFTYAKRWFVLAQTDGKAYEPEPVPGWDRAAALRTLGIDEVAFQELDGTILGYAKDRTIAINPLAPCQWPILFHEVGHVVLGHTQHADYEPHGRELPRNEREMEAEATALLCMETLGLPGADEARGYIQHWRRGSELTEEMAQRIFTAAETIRSAGRG